MPLDVWMEPFLFSFTSSSLLWRDKLLLFGGFNHKWSLLAVDKGNIGKEILRIFNWI